MIQVFYVAERNGGSLSHGMFEYETATGLFRNGPDGPAGETMEKQARAYVESYLRRKQEPEEQSRNPHRR